MRPHNALSGVVSSDVGTNWFGFRQIKYKNVKKLVARKEEELFSNLFQGSKPSRIELVDEIYFLF